jgi:enoyl-CoA hydratase/carnithine racemase
MDDPYAAALATAREIADKNPDAIRADKRILNAMADSTDAELLLAESTEQDKIIGSANQKEAVIAQMEKRRPTFAN